MEAIAIIKKLRSITTESYDEILEIMLGDAIQAVKNYCHIKHFPPELEPVARQLVIQEFNELTGDLPVESVKRGDTQITYGGTIDSSKLTDKQRGALNGYRKFGTR